MNAPNNGTGQNETADSAVSHWWRQRLTAIFLVPLVLWFTASFVSLSNAGISMVREWIASPGTALFLAIFMAVLFRHIQLGLEVVVDDYVHTRRCNRSTIMLIRLACGLGIVVAWLSILCIYFDGQAR